MNALKDPERTMISQQKEIGRFSDAKEEECDDDRPPPTDETDDRPVTQRSLSCSRRARDKTFQHNNSAPDKYRLNRMIGCPNLDVFGPKIRNFPNFSDSFI